MKKLFLIILLGQSLNALGQQIISKTVVDALTNKPIPSAHIYLSNDLKSGTVTNSDGRFVLKNTDISDMLIISHLSYKPYKKNISNILSDTIKLHEKTAMLKEINVRAESGLAVMLKIIDLLPMNHFVEPVMYNVYVRNLEYEKDNSEFHVLGEFLLNVYQNKKHRSQFRMLKTRASPFSKAGNHYFKDMRIMDAIGIAGNNLGDYSYYIFKKKKLSKYNIKISEHFTSEEQDFIKLSCTPKKEDGDLRSVDLWIDESSYAVQKITTYYSPSKKEYKEVTFKEINGKWYLDFVKRIVYTSRFSKWNSNSISILEGIAVYNINNETHFDKKEFQTYVGIVAEPIRLHIGDWSDNFWGNYSYIPLPNWIKQKMEHTDK